MKIETKTYKCITLSLSELGMLKKIEIERQKECDKHVSCNDCPFRETFFYRCGGSIAEQMENSHKIRLSDEEE